MSAPSPVAAMTAARNGSTAQDHTKPLTWAQRLVGKASAATISQTSMTPLVPDRPIVSSTPVSNTHSRTSSMSRQTASGSSNGAAQSTPASPMSGTASRPAGPSSTAGGKIRIPTNNSISAASVTTEGSWTGSQSESGNGSSNLNSQTTTNSSADISAATSVADTDARSPASLASTDISPQRALAPSSRKSGSSESAKTAPTMIDCVAVPATGSEAGLQGPAAAAKPPAGPPRVNVWQRRKEEQALKFAEQAAQKTAAALTTTKPVASQHILAETAAMAGFAVVNKPANATRDRSILSAAQIAKSSSSKPPTATLNTLDSSFNRQRGSSITSQSTKDPVASSPSSRHLSTPTVAVSPSHSSNPEVVAQNLQTNRLQANQHTNASVSERFNHSSDHMLITVKAGANDTALPQSRHAREPLCTTKSHFAVTTKQSSATAAESQQTSQIEIVQFTRPAEAVLAATTPLIAPTTRPNIAEVGLLSPTPMAKETNMVRDVSQNSSTESGQFKQNGTNQLATSSPEITTTVSTASVSPLPGPSTVAGTRTTPSPSGLTSLHASLPAKPLGVTTVVGPPRQRTSPSLLGQTGMRSPGMRSPIPSSRSPVSPRNGAGTPAQTHQTPITTPQSQAVFAALPPNATFYGDIRLLPPDANLSLPQSQSFSSSSMSHNQLASTSNVASSASPIDSAGSMRGGRRGVSSIRGRGSAYHHNYPNAGDRNAPRRMDRQGDHSEPYPGYRPGAQSYNHMYGGSMHNISQYGTTPHHQNGNGALINAFSPSGQSMGQSQGPMGYGGVGVSERPYNNFPNLQPQPYNMGQPQMWQPNIMLYQSPPGGSQTSSPRTGPRDLPGMLIPPPMPLQMQYNAAQMYSPSVDAQSQFMNGDAAHVHQSPAAFARPAPLFNYTHVAFPPDGAAFLVLGQLEYYFSPDNLIRDPFLRSSMDSEGWVEIRLIASFKRITQLTTDFNLVRDMCGLSVMLEVREAKVRRAGDWPQWILPGARLPCWHSLGSLPTQILPPSEAQSTSTAAIPSSGGVGTFDEMSLAGNELQPS